MEDSSQKAADLSRMFDQKGQNFAPASKGAAKRAGFPASNFSFANAKRKQKIELIILTVIVVAAIAVFIYYFVTKGNGRPVTEPEFIPAADGGI